MINFTIFGSVYITNPNGYRSNAYIFAGKLDALWPFLGIIAEVIILVAIILIYERRRLRQEQEQEETQDQ